MPRWTPRHGAASSVASQSRRRSRSATAAAGCCFATCWAPISGKLWPPAEHPFSILKRYPVSLAQKMKRSECLAVVTFPTSKQCSSNRGPPHPPNSPFHRCSSRASLSAAGGATGGQPSALGSREGVQAAACGAPPSAVGSGLAGAAVLQLQIQCLALASLAAARVWLVLNVPGPWLPPAIPTAQRHLARDAPEGRAQEGARELQASRRLSAPERLRCPLVTRRARHGQTGCEAACRPSAAPALSASLHARGCRCPSISLPPG